VTCLPDRRQVRDSKETYFFLEPLTSLLRVPVKKKEKFNRDCLPDGRQEKELKK